MKLKSLRRETIVSQEQIDELPPRSANKVRKSIKHNIRAIDHRITAMAMR